MLAATGAFSGFLAVALGAWLDHGLRAGLSDAALSSLGTALRYQQLHALAALAVGLALWARTEAPGRGWLVLGGWAFVFGTALFAGGIWLSTVGELPSLVLLTPFGGVTLMVAWLFVAVGAFLGRAHR